MIDDGAKKKKVALYSFAFLVCVLLTAGSYLKASSQNADSTPIEIKMTAKQFTFEPGTVTVRKGQCVKLILSTADVDHSFTIKELDLDIPIKAKQIKTVYFTPNKTGNFRYSCAVYCGAGHRKMYGELIVTE